VARDHKVKKYVHISTGSVYGRAQYFPQDEKQPLVPTSYYGVSKLAGERYAKCFNLLYDMEVTCSGIFTCTDPAGVERRGRRRVDLHAAA